MPEQRTAPPLEVQPTRTVTDQIFDLLYERVVNLTLAPGAKLSEIEVAQQMGVSRQPVRDAFYRLSKLGFIQIRPQRATVVTPISEDAVLQAYFIRSALEESVMRTAAQVLNAQHLASLEKLVEQQAVAVAADERDRFHGLDDQFHHDICKYAGLEFVWALIRENKGHMDRARYLSLTYGADLALAEHRQMLAALRGRDAETAAASAKQHLSRIESIIARLHIDRPEVFDG